MKPHLLLAFSFTVALYFSPKAQTNSTSGDTASTEIMAPNLENASFPGGEQALMNFVNTNRVYANEKDKKNRVGIVLLTFTIDKEGNIQEPIKVIRSLSEYYDQEGIRIVKSMPKWIPGKMNGRNINVQFNLPIRF
ncbi:MAG: energy transducer TonB [Bacteroidota bacterium]